MLGRCPSRPNAGLGAHDLGQPHFASATRRPRKSRSSPLILKVEVSVTVASTGAEVPGDSLVVSAPTKLTNFPFHTRARAYA
jgi:hypothetical protein